MRKPVEDALVLAFEHAAGRSPLPAAASLALRSFARRIVDAGRRAVEMPAVPRTWLRRAADLFQPPASRGGVRAALWRLVFDSWATASPAARGAGRPRFLRFCGPRGSLDVETMVLPGGEMRLRGTVDGPTGPLSLEVSPARGRSKPLHVPVRAGGAFAASVPAGSSPFALAVKSGRRTLVRTSRIPPARPG